LIFLGGCLLFFMGAVPEREESTDSMVLVPAGDYTQFFSTEGDVKTKHIPSFLMDSTAVTNAEFLDFVKRNPKWSRSRVAKIYADDGYLKHWEGDFVIGERFEQIKNSPVTNVSWFAANAYAKWKGKRLPSNDEWEYA